MSEVACAVGRRLVNRRRVRAMPGREPFAPPLAWSRQGPCEGGLPLVEGLGQPALGVDARCRAGARRGDGLAVDVVDDVAAGEDAVDGGARRRVLHLDVAAVVELELAGEQLAAGVV